MKTIIATLGLLAFGAATVAPPSYFLITSTERRQRRVEPDGESWREIVHTGGWGPHLRPLMRTGNGVFFAVDEASATTDNVRSVYYRFDGSRWAWYGQQEHLPDVGQNCARVFVEPHIWSYGMQSGPRPYLMESWFRTSPGSRDAGVRRVEIGGRPFIFPQGSNYVGAAVSPSGRKLVWYTTVGDRCRSRAGDFSYIYQLERGGEWVGPVVSPLATEPVIWDALGYVHASFKDDSTVSIVGQMCATRCPAPTYRAAVSEFQFDAGSQANFTLLAMPDGVDGSSGDIWVDRRTGDAHVLARTASTGVVAYYHKPGGAPWAGEPQPAAVFENGYRSRFTVDAAEGTLHLILGAAGMPGAVEVRSVGLNAVRGAVDWKAVVPVRPPLPADGFGTPAAIYVQSPDQQTTLARGLLYALCGSPAANPLPHDNLIIHVNTEPRDGVTEAGAR